MAAGGAEAKRAFEAMMNMKKIDVAAIEAARLAAGADGRTADQADADNSGDANAEQNKERVETSTSSPF